MGEKANADYCFPHRIEDVLVLQAAIQANPTDSKAFYYLGNYWYDKRQYKEAINCWEQSSEINPNFPTVHRNLCLAYYNKLNNPQSALESMEKAFSLDTTDARVLMELDQLYKILNHPLEKRLELLNKHATLTLQRDDLYLEKVAILNQFGFYSEAEKLLEKRIFHPWEGGEGKVVAQYLMAKIELAKEALGNNEYIKALEYLDATIQYPHNLGEGKLFGVQENDIAYLRGLVYEKIGDADSAKQYLNRQPSESVSLVRQYSTMTRNLTRYSIRDWHGKN